MMREREKQSVLRAKRLRRVRNVRCLRSIFCIVSFPTVYGSPSKIAAQVGSTVVLSIL